MITPIRMFNLSSTLALIPNVKWFEVCTKRTWPTQSDLKVFKTTSWRRTLWYNLAKLYYKDGEKDEVQRRGTPKNQKIPSPQTQKKPSFL
jgi:hypothetical protein